MVQHNSGFIWIFIQINKHGYLLGCLWLDIMVNLSPNQGLNLAPNLLLPSQWFQYTDVDIIFPHFQFWYYLWPYVITRWNIVGGKLISNFSATCIRFSSRHKIHLRSPTRAVDNTNLYVCNLIFKYAFWIQIIQININCLSEICVLIGCTFSGETTVFCSSSVLSSKIWYSYLCERAKFHAINTKFLRVIESRSWISSF